MQKRDSKSFDSGSLYRTDIDDDSNGTSSMERMERTDRNDSKIMLPTPPIRKSPLATASANQSEDHSITSIDRNKTDANNTGDGLNDTNKTETEPTSAEPNEVRDRESACIKYAPPINDNCDNNVDFLLISFSYICISFNDNVVVRLDRFILVTFYLCVSFYPQIIRKMSSTKLSA